MPASIDKEGSRSFIVSGLDNKEVIKAAHMEALWQGGLVVSEQLGLDIYRFGKDPWGRDLLIGVCWVPRNREREFPSVERYLQELRPLIAQL